MEFGQEVISSEFKIDTSAVLGTAATALAEFLAGAASAGRKEWFLSAGYLAQKLRGGQLLNQIKTEWDYYREKGKIKEDQQTTVQHLDCLAELLDFIDKDVPDDVRMTTMKKIFLVAASETKSQRDSILPQQYMRIARTMTSGELLVLKTCYSLINHKVQPHRDYGSADVWLSIITGESGLGTTDLVAIYEDKLIVKNLLSPRLHGDRSGVVVGEHGRLTNLGFMFCDFIEGYEALNK